LLLLLLLLLRLLILRELLLLLLRTRSLIGLPSHSFPHPSLLLLVLLL